MAFESGSVSQKRKRNCLSLDEKIQLIELIEGGKSQAEVFREKNVPCTTLNTIFINRDKIRKQRFEISGNRKKCRTSPNEEVKVALWQWFKQFTSENPSVPIDGNCLKIQATIANLKLRLRSRAKFIFSINARCQIT